MLNNRIFRGTVVAGVVFTFAACGGERQDTTVIEQPVIEQPAEPTFEPAPAPMTQDTMIVDTPAVTDTAPAATTPGE